MRNLAKLFIYEFLCQTSKNNREIKIKKAEDFPLPLRRMIDAIEILLEESVTYELLMFHSKKSIPTIHRLFQKYLHMTPREWINKRKLSIAEAAGRVCINDKYYFSRLFKKHMKITAGEYRRRYQTDEQN